MGQRYRFNWNDENDVLDPTAWVEDNSEFAGEFNGYLDRDNFARADIVKAEIVDESFTVVDSQTSTTTYTPDRQVVSWQGGGGNGALGIFQRTVTCDVDCALSVECNLTWTWASSAWSMVSDGAAAPGEVSTFRTNCVRFRIVVDGVDLCRTGFFDDTHRYFGTYLVGATVVTSGQHVVSIECEVSRRTWETLALFNNNTFNVDIKNRHLLVIQEKR